jgi:hypothetical protein
MKFVGTSLSPIILGMVLSYFDLEAVFIVAGSFGLLVALLTYLMRIFLKSQVMSMKKMQKYFCHISQLLSL